MKGLFVLLLISFTTSVSFASDGPKTTKECSIEMFDINTVNAVVFDVVSSDYTLHNVERSTNTDYVYLIDKVSHADVNILAETYFTRSMTLNTDQLSWRDYQVKHNYKDNYKTRTTTDSNRLIYMQPKLC